MYLCTNNFRAAGLSALLTIMLSLTSAAIANDAPKAGVTPATALNRLVAGNQRFASGKMTRPNDDPARIKSLASGQAPFVTVLSCSDSRVPPELVFDQGLGDVFTVRVAGNIADAAAICSIEYAAAHLGSSLIIVMGHEKCGAVTGALDAKNGKKDSIPGIAALLDSIVPAYDSVNANLGRDAQVHAGIEANVLQTVAKLKELPELKSVMVSRGIWILGAIYDVSTGNVRFLKTP
ncbi:MAG: carbonic anhydrase [bacterium]